MKIYYFILLFFFALQPHTNSQQPDTKNYITIIPGEQYAASGFYEFWFGEHWREVWTTPIKVEVLNLDKFAGGLIPIERGGGMQTKSLRFEGKNGKISGKRSWMKK